MSILVDDLCSVVISCTQLILLIRHKCNNTINTFAFHYSIMVAIMSILVDDLCSVVITCTQIHN